MTLYKVADTSILLESAPPLEFGECNLCLFLGSTIPIVDDQTGMLPHQWPSPQVREAVPEDIELYPRMYDVEGSHFLCAIVTTKFV